MKDCLFLTTSLKKLVLPKFQLNVCSSPPQGLHHFMRLYSSSRPSLFHKTLLLLKGFIILRNCTPPQVISQDCTLPQGLHHFTRLTLHLMFIYILVHTSCWVIRTRITLTVHENVLCLVDNGSSIDRSHSVVVFHFFNWACTLISTYVL